ncbi:MAG: hypothetical protein HFE90_05815 [Firmicutes bacterium]|nr:hypothetical protein [Bacillota bacterium]
MEKETSTFKTLISKELRPAYYDDFTCTGSACRITCCQNWEINFDRKDYLNLKKLRCSPELSEKLNHAIKRVRGNHPEVFYAKFNLLDNGFCPMLNENGLCYLQLEQGYTVLPFVCKDFPRRKRYYFTGYLERSLSPACEAVLEHLWNLTEGVEFRITALPESKIRNLEADNASPLIKYAKDIQDICISILQDRRLPLPQRIILMGAKLQELTKENADIPAWISKIRTLLADPEAIIQYRALAPDSRGKMIYINNNMYTLFTILESTSAYPQYIIDLLKVLHSDSEDTADGHLSFDLSKYYESETAFNEIFGDIEYFFENLAVTILFHMKIPALTSPEEMWKSYVGFCSLYSFLRFVSVLSAKAQFTPPTKNSRFEAPEPGSRDALFHALVIASRVLMHSESRSEYLRDEFFKNESSSLAHMAILVSG